jgi:hypothetical protein
MMLVIDEAHHYRTPIFRRETVCVSAGSPVLRRRPAGVRPHHGLYGIRLAACRCNLPVHDNPTRSPRSSC